MKNFAKIQKFDILVILFVRDRIRTFQAVSNAFLMRDGQSFGYSTFE